MRFLDSSALVPLLAKEDMTEKMIRLMEEDPVVLVSDYKPQNLLFVCLDHRLIDAAKAEGFSIRDKSFV